MRLLTSITKTEHLFLEQITYSLLLTSSQGKLWCGLKLAVPQISWQP